MRTAAHWLKMPGLGALHRQRGVGLAALLMTRDGDHANPMTISWTMVIDFTPIFAITTGEWNHSFARLAQASGVRHRHSRRGPARQGGGHRHLLNDPDRQAGNTVLMVMDFKEAYTMHL